MPLSDREQQILKEIERDLLSDGSVPDAHEAQPAGERGRIKAGAGVFFLGLLCLVGFFVTSAIVLGILAFAAMVGGLFLIVGGIREVALRNFRDLSEGREGLLGQLEDRFRDRHKRS